MFKTMDIFCKQKLCIGLIQALLIFPIAVNAATDNLISLKSSSRFRSTLVSRIAGFRGGDAGVVGGKKKYKAVQVQIIHRHGDRSPITPMKNIEFWQSTLVSPDLLDKISEGTSITRREQLVHKAHGQGPFGKLTKLGLFQMIDVGSTLREELSSETVDSYKVDGNGNMYNSAIWDPSHPLCVSDIKILSTDFPRTIQSVQGVLVGLFPDGLDKPLDIDCRHTTWMIPDPQPRRSVEQEELEATLALRPHVVERDVDMKPLALRCTDALRHLLGEGAFDMAFGVGEDNVVEDSQARALPWAQLAEITTCLKARDLLPENISGDDQEAISKHCAWRWFESLRNPRLSYLAMHKFAHNIIHSMRHFSTEPKLTIYSAHDSTLIGLMCAFRLEQPSVWPEYGSYLKMELLEVLSEDEDTEKEHVVRFYLNGELLRSQWHGDLKEEISLSSLSNYVSKEGALKQT